MSGSPLLIAGLGNPGEKYARHRHNVGFMAVDAIAERHDFPPFRPRYQGLASEGTLGGRKTLLRRGSEGCLALPGERRGPCGDEVF